MYMHSCDVCNKTITIARTNHTSFDGMRTSAAARAAETVLSHPRSLAGRVTKQKRQQQERDAQLQAPIPKHQRQPRPQRPAPGHHDLGQGAYVHYTPSAFGDAADSLFTALVDSTPWLHRAITVMGRRVMQPRLVCYMGDTPSLRYTYSGTTWEPVPWSASVLQIKVLCGCCTLVQTHQPHRQRWRPLRKPPSTAVCSTCTVTGATTSHGTATTSPCMDQHPPLHRLRLAVRGTLSCAATTTTAAS